MLTFGKQTAVAALSILDVLSLGGPKLIFNTAVRIITKKGQNGQPNQIVGICMRRDYTAVLDNIRSNYK